MEKLFTTPVDRTDLRYKVTVNNYSALLAEPFGSALSQIIMLC